MQKMKTEMTTGDEKLDAAINALMASAIYEATNYRNVADSMEEAVRNLDYAMTYKIAALRVEDDAIRQKENDGYGVEIGRVDQFTADILKIVQKFNREIQKNLISYYCNRADVIKEAAELNGKLFKSIIDCATEHNKTCDVTDIETCASDSEMTTF